MKAILKPQEEERILQGHPWIFRNEVDKIEGKIIGGGIVEVYNHENKFIARGYLNFASKILIRVLTLKENEMIDEFFLEKRILKALELRNDVRYNSSCRLIFSESDYLPGLIVDRYGDYLVIEISTLGMEMLKETIVRILHKVLQPLGIYERSDNSSRIKEGLEPHIGFIGEPFDTNIVILENGYKMKVDIANGQKTGYFLDQTENRDNLRNYVKNKKVLDCFSHTGSFAINAAGSGAKHVTAVEISELAMEKIKENILLNEMDNIECIQADVFDFLTEELANNHRYDVIILDPPAFTKNKDTIKQAIKGYQKINIDALKLLNPGGYLITFSCSGHMTPDLFLEVLNEASQKARRTTQMIEYRLQTKDHPMLLAAPDTIYLKCAVLRVID